MTDRVIDRVTDRVTDRRGVDSEATPESMRGLPDARAVCVCVCARARARVRVRACKCVLSPNRAAGRPAVHPFPPALRPTGAALRDGCARCAVQTLACESLNSNSRMGEFEFKPCTRSPRRCGPDRPQRRSSTAAASRPVAAMKTAGIAPRLPASLIPSLPPHLRLRL